MPLKPFERLTAPRRAKARTRAMRSATSQRSLRETRLKNLTKARRVRKKNLLLKKRISKKS